MLGLHFVMIAPQFCYQVSLSTRRDIIFPVAAGTITTLHVLSADVVGSGGSPISGVTFVQHAEHRESKKNKLIVKASSLEGIAKLHLGSNLCFCLWIRISHKSPMANRICRFARN
jgi:hypothetical protein